MAAVGGSTSPDEADARLQPAWTDTALGDLMVALVGLLFVALC